MSFITLVREDLAHHDHDWSAPGFQALAVYRFGHFARARRGLSGMLLRRVHRFLFVFVRNVYGIELPAEAVIGRRMYIGHEHGIILNGKTEFGDDCVLSHNITTAIGAPGKAALPHFGDRVTIGPNAVIVGRVDIGDDVCIGPNAVVITDVPPGAQVFKQPTRVLQLHRP